MDTLSAFILGIVPNGIFCRGDKWLVKIHDFHETIDLKCKIIIIIIVVVVVVVVVSQ